MTWFDAHIISRCDDSCFAYGNVKADGGIDRAEPATRALHQRPTVFQRHTQRAGRSSSPQTRRTRVAAMAMSRELLLTNSIGRNAIAHTFLGSTTSDTRSQVQGSCGRWMMGGCGSTSHSRSHLHSRNESCCASSDVVATRDRDARPRCWCRCDVLSSTIVGRRRRTGWGRGTQARPAYGGVVDERWQGARDALTNRRNSLRMFENAFRL